MPAHLSIGTALDKNLVGSANVYLILLEVDIIDPNTGDVLQTLYCAQNNEDFVWNGQLYTMQQFEVEMTQDNKSAPSCTLTVYDITQVFQAQLQSYGWQLAWPCRIKVVNATTPTLEPEIEQDFTILSASCTDDKYAIQFTIGAENPLTLQFPPRAQYVDKCYWIYKGSDCQYSGPLTSCDYTWDGANGCLAHSNNLNYGGFPGLHQTNGQGQ